MRTFAQIHNLRQADVITVPVTDLNITEHYIVYLGQDEYGQDLYLENKIGYGVRSIYDPLHTGNIPYFNSIRRFNGTCYERNRAIQRGLSLLGSKYDLVDFNCEHFANYVQYGLVYSKQVDTAKTIAAIGGGLLLFAGLASLFGGGNRR